MNDSDTIMVLKAMLATSDNNSLILIITEMMLDAAIWKEMKPFFTSKIIVASKGTYT